MTIDELLIKLGLDSSGVKSGMKQAENSISGGLSSLTTKLGAFSAAITAAFSLGTAWAQYTEQADAMGKLADAIDVDIEKLHAWSETAARAGGSTEAFQASLQQLSGQLARTALTGTSRAKSVLEGAGIDAGEIGRQREAFDVMMDLAEKAETMGKAEFFGLGRALGLDTGTIMMLQQGRAALKDAIQAQKEFGVYTKEDAKITADFNDRMADFGQVFRSFASIIFRVVLPPLNDFLRTTNKIIAFLRKHETAVKAFFIGLATVITAYAIPALMALASAMLANPVTWLIAGLVGLALVIEDLVVWAQGGESAMGDLWAAIFGSPEDAAEMWEAIKSGFAEMWEFIKPILAWIGEAIKTAFKEGIPALADFVRDMKAGIKLVKDAFVDLANSIISTMTRAFNWVIEKWNAVAGVLGMTEINVHADIHAAEISAADVSHGGGGGSIDNSTHDVSINNTYNIESTDPQGAAAEVGNTTNNWADQADLAYG